MTEKMFRAIIDVKNITWNDIVEITILNPNYNIFKFKPKLLKFEGALGYHHGDKILSIYTDDGNLFFDYDKIVGLKLIKK